MVGLLVIIGVLAAVALPEGNLLRFVLALPVLFFAPGYLLLQALIPAGPESRRMWHALVAVGLSPVLVGLLALSTALVPGGFKPLPILIVVTLGSLVLLGLAAYRRMSRSEPVLVPEEGH